MRNLPRTYHFVFKAALKLNCLQFPLRGKWIVSGSFCEDFLHNTLPHNPINGLSTSEACSGLVNELFPQFLVLCVDFFFFFCQEIKKRCKVIYSKQEFLLLQCIPPKKKPLKPNKHTDITQKGLHFTKFI